MEQNLKAYFMWQKHHFEVFSYCVTINEKIFSGHVFMLWLFDK